MNRKSLQEKLQEELCTFIPEYETRLTHRLDNNRKSLTNKSYRGKHHGDRTRQVILTVLDDWPYKTRPSLRGIRRYAIDFYGYLLPSTSGIHEHLKFLKEEGLITKNLRVKNENWDKKVSEIFPVK